ncbi:hypothetical protein SteCoe_32918 [Stentor coeruleus]|uniref:Protein kinase domain-containing protein n=1 Tax=Stentor coeruleus TaxID=5963 RepID=A0A1R2AXV8_9CILI|nr:hypothetical protein SteCoe_32918 [Stentor coeruleus]
MDFINTWHLLTSRRNSKKIIQLDEVIILENSFTSHEYYLTHKYENTQYIFCGADNENNRCIIKLMPLPSFDDIKFAYKNLSLLKDFGEKYKFTKIKDIFEIYEDQWVLVIVCEYLEGLTIREILEFSDDLDLPKEMWLMMFVRLMKIIDKAGKEAIMLNMFPDTIMIIEDQDDGNLIYENEGLRLGVKIITYHQICSNRPKHDAYCLYRKNTIENAIFGVSLCLYMLFTMTKYEDVPNFKEMDEEKRLKTLQVADAGINSFLTLVAGKSFKPETLLTFWGIKLWRVFQKTKYTKLDDIVIKDINCLMTIFKLALVKFSYRNSASCYIKHSQMFVNCKNAFLAMKKILAIAGENPGEVNKALGSSETFFDFFKVFIEQKSELVKQPILFNSILILLKDKSMSEKFKSTLVSLGFLTLIPEFIGNNVKSDLLCKVCLNFIENNTLTLQQILWDSGFVKNILVKATRSVIENDFIKTTMSYYGKNSLKFIMKVYELLDISKLRIFQNIYEIPVVFKLDSISSLFPILHELWKKGTKIPPEALQDVLKTLIHILSEVACLQPFLELQHLKGECTSKSSQDFLTYFGKNPILIKCLNCNPTSSYCVICYEKYHKKHEIQFLHYQAPMFRCSELEDSESVYKLDFRLPKYTNDMQFIELYGCSYERFSVSKLNLEPNKTFISAFSVDINSNEDSDFYNKDRKILSPNQQRQSLLSPPLNSGIRRKSEELQEEYAKSLPQADAYFEVKIVKAGFYEEIFIGITGTGVFYNCKTGNIFRNGHIVSKGPRLGSYDTIGIGLFQKKIFFTYNGLILRPIIPCFIIHPIKAYISSGSYNSPELEVKFSNWIFMGPYTSLVHANSDADNLIKFIMKKVIKLNSRKETKNEDLVDKFLELLRIMSKSDLLDKMQTFKIKNFS